MNKKMTVFRLFFLMLLAAIALYWRVPAVREKVASYTEEDFTDENVYTDLYVIAERLKEEIQKGSDEFTIYMKDIDVNQLEQINSFLDGIYGSGATYQQVGSVGDSCKKVKITIEKTINFYAVQAYQNGTPIPDSDQRAETLYRVIKGIMGSQITNQMTDYEKELALHDYLVANCTYSENVSQSAESDIYRAYGALVNHDAVCNGYAEAMKLLLDCAGVRSEFVAGTAGGVDHAWNLVELDGKWYHLDTTWDDPVPDRGEQVVHPYFNVTDAVMGQSHTWERMNHPAAESMDQNYYMQNRSYFYSFAAYKEAAYVEMVDGDAQSYEAVVEGYVERKDDMQFLFENNNKYSKVNWHCFEEGRYKVLVINAE